MKLLLRAARLALSAVVVSTVVPACYTAGGGTPPPTKSFYFPTGLAVSTGGNVLYAANSDFDLQWNGGTLQSYDLFQIRNDAATLIEDNLACAASPDPAQCPTPALPFIEPWQPNCAQGLPPPPTNDLSGEGLLLGEACAPAIDSSTYVRDSAIIGAFATDLQVSRVPDPGNPGGFLPSSRLYAPVSGNATVTWAALTPDVPGAAPSEPSSLSSFAPFALGCGTRTDARCDGDHAAGDNPSDPGDTRGLTLPGEPFGMAQSQDGTALVVTSETSTDTSVLSSGLGSSEVIAPQPTMQFILQGVPNGGVGVAAVPHDPLGGYTRCEDVGDQQPCIRQAFLQTYRDSTELDLLRYYDDYGASLRRPFLEKERAYTINSNLPGTDSRGIAIDASERIACEAQPGLTAAETVACAQLPARVFIANRAPATIVVGTIGASSASGDGTYDPDLFQPKGNISLPIGPSKVYLAPVVMHRADGTPFYQLELFVVCFDTDTIFVIDPEQAFNLLLAPIGIITTGVGPYALAFDPFSLEDAATNAVIPPDTRPGASAGLLPYRFAYVASFTQSYVQMIDLDLDAPEGGSFPIVYTLGKPTPPKGQ
jgi:hypothetical protein